MVIFHSYVSLPDVTIDVLFPLVCWLIEGLEQTPLRTGFYDDMWYTSSRPIYFYQKDIIGCYSLGMAPSSFLFPYWYCVFSTIIQWSIFSRMIFGSSLVLTCINSIQSYGYLISIKLLLGGVTTINTDLKLLKYALDAIPKERWPYPMTFWPWHTHIGQ